MSLWTGGKYNQVKKRVIKWTKRSFPTAIIPSLLNCWSRLWIIASLCHKTINSWKEAEVCMQDGSFCWKKPKRHSLLPHPICTRSFDLLQQGFLITKLHNIITFLYQSFLLDSGANQFRQKFHTGTLAFFLHSSLRGKSPIFSMLKTVISLFRMELFLSDFQTLY